jgi:FkbM family methyltransferase
MLHQVVRQKLSEISNLVLFDIGACDFSEGVNFKRSFPNSDVYSIEADKINYERHYRAANKGGVKTFNVAFSNENGTATFYPSIFETKKNIDWRYAGSIIKPLLKENSNEALNHTVSYDMNGYEVRTVRIDTFCIENNIPKIDYIHIDVEGAEDKVLSSMGRFKPLFIFAETAHFDKKSYDNKLNLKEFDILMEQLGYKIYERFEYDTLYNKI